MKRASIIDEAIRGFRILTKRTVRGSQMGGGWMSEVYLKLRKRSVVQAFCSRFFGGDTTFYSELYDAIDEEFTDKIDKSRLNFDGILIPKSVNENHKIYFATEFIDMLTYFLCGDWRSLNLLSGEGPYETDNVRLANGDIVIDCGANVGMFSAVSAHKGCKVFAFEPSQSIINHYLKKVAAWNPGISVCRYALSDKREEIVFYDQSEYEGMTGHIENAVVPTEWETLRRNECIVQAVTLDEFVVERGLDRIDFIKADIEGSERLMLAGAKKVISEFAPKLAICTYHLPDDPEVLSQLILDANPNYVIEHKYMKLYARVP